MLGTTNISTSTVKTALSENTYNVGKLCTSENINMWAKYKPVWYPANAGDLNTIAKASYNGNAPGNHHDGDYGVAASNIYNYSSDTTTRNNNSLLAAKGNWDYAKPEGGWTSPYRLGDFRKYEHTAIPPIYMSLYYLELTINTAKVSKQRYWIDWVESGDDTGSIAIEDLTANTGIDFKRTKLRAIVTNSDGTILSVTESDDYIYNGVINGTYGNCVDIDVAGKYQTLYVYLCMTYYPESGTILYLPIPKSNVTASMPLILHCLYDTEDAGYGIKDVYNDVLISMTNSLSSSSSYPWMNIGYICDSDIGSHTMLSSMRNIALKITFTNSGEENFTLYKSDILLELLDNSYKKVSDYMVDYTNNPNGNTNVSSVVIPANGKLQVGLLWEACLPNVSGQNIWEITIYKGETLLVGYDLYIRTDSGDGFEEL